MTGSVPTSLVGILQRHAFSLLAAQHCPQVVNNSLNLTLALVYQLQMLAISAPQEDSIADVGAILGSER